MTTLTVAVSGSVNAAPGFTPTPTFMFIIIPGMVLNTPTPTLVPRITVPSATPPPVVPAEVVPPSEAAAVDSGPAPVPTSTAIALPAAPVPPPAMVAPVGAPASPPNFFQQNIQGPFTLALGQLTCLTNLLLALILALAFGFFGNLLNNTLESNESGVARLFAPFTRLLQAIRERIGRLTARLKGMPFRAISFSVKLILVLLASGAVLAYLDPDFHFGQPGGLSRIIALASSIALIALLDDLVLYFLFRRRGGSADLRLHGGNFLLVLISTFFSRLFGLAPGLMLGSPAGLENVEHDIPPVWVDVLALGVTGLAALAAWFASTLFAGSAWWNTVLLLIFAAGIQSLFFEMMPIGYLRGRGIFRASPLAWFGLFAGVTFLFLHTMLNPDGDFIRAFDSPNMVSLAIMVVAFCLFSTALWLFFRGRDRSFTSDGIPPAAPPP